LSSASVEYNPTLRDGGGRVTEEWKEQAVQSIPLLIQELFWAVITL
jgi:hypothetical protein